ncbi:hypothetical protein [Peribacillus sp. TH27]|nr:hypothetical protein [Peribacillus sp. TH27]
MSLKGKRVAVLGGTSGIGLAAAKAFIDESAQVIIASVLLQNYLTQK